MRGCSDTRDDEPRVRLVLSADAGVFRTRGGGRYPSARPPRRRGTGLRHPHGGNLSPGPRRLRRPYPDPYDRRTKSKGNAKSFLGCRSESVLPADAGVFRWPTTRRTRRRSPPRRCGGVPSAASATCHEHQSSPPMRGCSAAIDVLAARLSVLPADAGVFRCRTASRARPGSPPRRCGGVPTVGGWGKWLWQSSPPTRGCSNAGAWGSSPPTRGCSGEVIMSVPSIPVLPADAGVFCRPRPRRSPRRGPPCSPHPRGWSQLRHLLRQGVGLLPASARVLCSWRARVAQLVVLPGVRLRRRCAMACAVLWPAVVGSVVGVLVSVVEGCVRPGHDPGHGSDGGGQGCRVCISVPPVRNGLVAAQPAVLVCAVCWSAWLGSWSGRGCFYGGAVACDLPRSCPSPPRRVPAGTRTSASSSSRPSCHPASCSSYLCGAVAWCPTAHRASPAARSTAAQCLRMALTCCGGGRGRGPGDCGRVCAAPGQISTTALAMVVVRDAGCASSRPADRGRGRGWGARRVRRGRAGAGRPVGPPG